MCSIHYLHIVYTKHLPGWFIIFTNIGLSKLKYFNIQGTECVMVVNVGKRW